MNRKPWELSDSRWLPRLKWICCRKITANSRTKSSIWPRRSRTSVSMYAISNYRKVLFTRPKLRNFSKANTHPKWSRCQVTKTQLWVTASPDHMIPSSSIPIQSQIMGISSIFSSLNICRSTKPQTIFKAKDSKVLNHNPSVAAAKPVPFCTKNIKI